jgi:hypothetical protein
MDIVILMSVAVLVVLGGVLAGVLRLAVALARRLDHTQP